MSNRKVIDVLEERVKYYELNFDKGSDEIMEAIKSAIEICKHEGESQTVLEAWYAIFGTTQLTHASDRLEVAEKEAKKYQKLLKSYDELKEDFEGQKKQRMMWQETANNAQIELAELKKKIDVNKFAEIVREDWDDISRAQAIVDFINGVHK